MTPGSNDADPMVGQTLVGRYLIQRKLGEGGMGSVYLATHIALEKLVALKVLHGEFSRKPDLIERFLQEAKAASRIRHDNIIDITDFGQTDDGMVFFAMEMLDGHDLSEELALLTMNGQRMPWARSKPIFLQVLSALSAAHSVGIIHRDLKPENIFLIERLGHSDFVKLLDFGIAKMTEVNDEGRKLTKTGMLFGTPEYMSPEQARGEKVDHRVDIYAMGCILFQLISGRVPFEADNFMGILTMHLTQETPLLGPALAEVGAPPEVEGLVQRALSKSRDARFPSIDAFIQALSALNDGVAAGPNATVMPRSAPAIAVPAPTAEPVRTQWTGSVKLPTDASTESVPALDGQRPNKGLLVAVLTLLLAGGAVGAFMVTRGGDGDQGASTASAGGTEGAGAGDNSTAEPMPTMAIVRVESAPAGASITDVTTGKVIGQTPQDITIPRGTEPRQLELNLDGYQPQTVAVIPNKDRQQLDSLELVAVVTATDHGKTGRRDKRDKRDKHAGKEDKPTGTADTGEPETPGEARTTTTAEKDDSRNTGDDGSGSGTKTPLRDPFSTGKSLGGAGEQQDKPPAED